MPIIKHYHMFHQLIPIMSNGFLIFLFHCSDFDALYKVCLCTEAANRPSACRRYFFSFLANGVLIIPPTPAALPLDDRNNGCMTEMDLIPSSMHCSHVCTLALAFIENFTAIPVLASHLRLENEHLLDSVALRPTSAHDDHINISGSLRSRDMDQAHTNDLMSLSNQKSTTAAKRSANIYNHVGSLPGSKSGYSLSVSERSLLTDLAKTGFSVVRDYMGITYSSYVAFYQTTELWANIMANAQGKWKAEQKVMTLDISYGSLKLGIAGITDAISWELVGEIAAEMLGLSRVVVLGAFRLIVFANWAAFVLTLAIAEQVLGTIKPYQLVTWP